MNPFTTLGIPPTVDLTSIKRAWRIKAHLHHPDKHGDPEKFRECLEAYKRIDTEEKALREVGNGVYSAYMMDRFSSDILRTDMTRTRGAGISKVVFDEAVDPDGPSIDFGFASFRGNGWNFD